MFAIYNLLQVDLQQHHELVICDFDTELKNGSGQINRKTVFYFYIDTFSSTNFTDSKPLTLDIVASDCFNHFQPTFVWNKVMTKNSTA